MLSLLAWIPAIVFPLSQGFQLYTIQHEKRVDDFNPLSFILILFINICSYIFANQFLNIKTILAFIIPGLFIIGTLYTYYRRIHQPGRSRDILIFGCAFYMFGMYVVTKYGHLLGVYSDTVGMLVAIVLPLAVLHQLIRVVKNRNTRGVSKILWALQCAGNIGCYVLVGKYSSPINIIAYLVTAVLCLGILVIPKKMTSPTLDKIPSISKQ